MKTGKAFYLRCAGGSTFAVELTAEQVTIYHKNVPHNISALLDTFPTNLVESLQAFIERHESHGDMTFGLGRLEPDNSEID